MSRTPTEIRELRSIQLAPKISVHGVITALSPLKKGRTCNYFEGSVSDDTDRTRFVGFSSSQRRLLSEFMERRKTVSIQDCQAKLARRGDKIELLLKGSTKIKASSKTFDIPWQEFDLMEPPTREISLSEIQTAEVYERVTAAVKVQMVTDPVVAGDKKKQEVYIADHSTANAVVQLWEEDIGMMAEGISYKLSGFLVREYAYKRYLSRARNNSTITEIEDIGDVVDPTPEDMAAVAVCGESEVLYGAEIVGVPKIESHKVCLRCKARVEPSTEKQGRCSSASCRMLQRYDVCPEVQTAKLLLLSMSGLLASVNVTGKVLEEMAGGEITDETLISLPKFTKLKYNKDNCLVSSFSY